MSAPALTRYVPSTDRVDTDLGSLTTVRGVRGGPDTEISASSGGNRTKIDIYRRTARRSRMTDLHE
jgi:hypothetical protein